MQVAREIFKFQLEQKNIGPGTPFLPSSTLTQTFKSQVMYHLTKLMFYLSVRFDRFSCNVVSCIVVVKAKIRQIFLTLSLQ